jgi:hypothetical protein
MSEDVTTRTRKRRWFRAWTQFSLRSLLIGITILCVALAALKPTVEPLDISFENDLRFAECKGQPFDRTQLTQRIHGLDGSPVRIKGYIIPQFQQFGCRQFVLEWSNQW